MSPVVNVIVLTGCFDEVCTYRCNFKGTIIRFSSLPFSCSALKPGSIIWTTGRRYCTISKAYMGVRAYLFEKLHAKSSFNHSSMVDIGEQKMEIVQNVLNFNSRTRRSFVRISNNFCIE